MRLTGDAARKWLAENPNASFIDNKTGTQYPGTQATQSTQQSGLMSLLASITKPVRTIPSSILEMGRGVSDLLDIAKGGEATKSAGYTDRIDKGYYPGLTEEEIESFKKDPALASIKAGTGMLAYGIPGGGGSATTALGRIGTAAGKGAVGGALGGFGASEMGEELGSTLKGGLTGGLVGGALQGVGEGAQALAKKVRPRKEITDQAIQNLNISKKTTKDLKGWENVKESGSIFYNSADDLGLDVSNAKVRPNAMQKILEKYGDDVSRGLEASDKMVSFRNVLKELDNNDLLKLAALDEKPFVQELRKVLASQGDEVSGAVAKGVIERLDEIAGGYPRIAGDVTSQRNQIIKEFRNALRTELGNKIPEINAPLYAQSKLLDIADDIYAQSAGQGSISIPVLGIKVKGAGIGKAQDYLADAVARGVKKPIISQGSADLIEKLAGLGQQGIPAVGAMQGMQSPVQEQEVQGGMADQVFGISKPQQLQMKIAENQQQRAEMFNSLLSQGLSYTQVKAMVDANIPEMKATDLTTVESNYASAANGFRKAYDLLRTQGGSGKLATFTGNIASFFGNTTASSEYKAAINTATAYVRNALIGAGQTEIEMKNIDLPKATDEPAIAIQKLEALIPFLEERATPQLKGGSDLTVLLNSLGYEQ